MQSATGSGNPVSPGPLTRQGGTLDSLDSLDSLDPPLDSLDPFGQTPGGRSYNGASTGHFCSQRPPLIWSRYLVIGRG